MSDVAKRASRLTVLRHGHAVDRCPTGDFDRALDERGHAEIERAARELRALSSLPSLILASPARRTRESAAYFASRSAVECSRSACSRSSTLSVRRGHAIRLQITRPFGVHHAPAMACVTEACRRSQVSCPWRNSTDRVPSSTRKPNASSVMKQGGAVRVADAGMFRAVWW